jgi:hypothetical protein
LQRGHYRKVKEFTAENAESAEEDQSKENKTKASLGTPRIRLVAFTLLVQKIFPKYSWCPLIRLAEMLFMDGSETSLLVTFAPPNPPPRRGKV